MTDREKFAKWYCHEYLDFREGNNCKYNHENHEYSHLDVQPAYRSCQAHQPEIDALKSLNSDFYRVIGEQNDSIDKLKAESEKLRKAAQDMCDWYNEPGFSMRFDRVMDNLNAAMTAPDTKGE